MSAPTIESAVMLTEHLQYPAVSLIDDIINAVNEIMYKCTAAMEKYLLEKHEVNSKDYTAEIKIGIAKLETLLEHSVDKNFDKLELYVLRNVLRIPQELLNTNTFRLKYQRDLVIADESQQQESVEQLKQKVQQIEEAFATHKQLRLRITQAKRLHNKVQELKQCLTKLFEGRNPEIQTVFNSLSPIDDSLKLITSQLRQMYLDSEEYGSMEKINDLNDGTDAKQRLGSRSLYIETRAQLILNTLQSDKVDNLINSKARDTITIASNTDLNIEEPDLSVLK